MTAETIYDRLGGAEGVRTLVDRFYSLMDVSPEASAVRGLHPASLENSADSLFKYLTGWFGGPPIYVQERGHPRLRARHLPFRIGTAERDEWMLCMSSALRDCVSDDGLRSTIERAFQDMAHHMVNE
jgi:hemoglobin